MLNSILETIAILPVCEELGSQQLYTHRLLADDAVGLVVVLGPVPEEYIAVSTQLVYALDNSSLQLIIASLITNLDNITNLKTITLAVVCST